MLVRFSVSFDPCDGMMTTAFPSVMMRAACVSASYGLRRPGTMDSPCPAAAMAARRLTAEARRRAIRMKIIKMFYPSRPTKIYCERLAGTIN